MAPYASKSKDVTPEAVKNHLTNLRGILRAAGNPEPKQAAKLLKSIRDAGMPIAVGGVAASNTLMPDGMSFEDSP